MLFYFVAFSVLIVSWVFDSAAVDYRFVALGSVIPLIEVPTGHGWALHTLLAPIIAFIAVSAAARGSRIVQRQWIGLPIGMFLHLVLDRTWARADLFWWPIVGTDELGTHVVPEFDPLAFSFVAELSGIVLFLWIVRRAELGDPTKRERLFKDGRLSLR
jgi:membrane-bound metal-dependent hydrolase YbcI (DUF457 family)